MSIIDQIREEEGYLPSLYSVFKHEFINDKGKWVSEYNFYLGDLSEEDFKNDWRFKEVVGKRAELQFLGLVRTDFPVTYPLKTTKQVCHQLESSLLPKSKTLTIVIKPSFYDDFPDFPKAEPSIKDYAVLS